MMDRIHNVTPVSVGGQRAFAPHWRVLTQIGMALADIVAALLVVSMSSFVYHQLVYGHGGDARLTLELAVILSAIFFFTNLLQRRYRLTKYLSTKGQMFEAFNVWNVTMIAFIAVAFLAKILDNYSRAAVIVSYLAGIPVMALVRWWVVKIVSIASKTGRISSQRILIVGREAEIATFLNRHQPWNTGLMIEDMITFKILPDDASAHDRAAHLDADLTHAVAVARERRPDGVFIALPWSARADIERCIDAFMNVPVSINLAPEPVLDRFENPRIIRTGTISSLELTPPALTTTEIITKRVFDFVGAALLSLALTPLFAIVAVLIKLDSKGPVFFLQRRYGFNQQPFRIFKFRTMTCMDDGDQVVQAKKNDPRSTRIGAWLRRYNIDELPQLLNVLQGQMSLVGPRPHALAHDREYEQKISLYARRHNVKPGITGWAQVHGLRGETDTDDKMAKRVTYDLWYIDNWNVWLDVIIMLRTVFSRKAFKNAH